MAPPEPIWAETPKLSAVGETPGRPRESAWNPEENTHLRNLRSDPLRRSGVPFAKQDVSGSRLHQWSFFHVKDSDELIAQFFRLQGSSLVPGVDEEEAQHEVGGPKGMHLSDAVFFAFSRANWLWSLGLRGSRWAFPLPKAALWAQRKLGV